MIAAIIRHTIDLKISIIVKMLFAINPLVNKYNGLSSKNASYGNLLNTPFTLLETTTTPLLPNPLYS